MSENPREILKESFSALPTIGDRQAERFVDFISRSSPEFINRFSKALIEYKVNLKVCEKCNCFTLYKNICSICLDSTRNKEILILIENAKDIKILEQNNELKTHYFLVRNMLPISKNIENSLEIKDLKKRIVDSKDLKEILFAFAAHSDADNTIYVYRNEIKKVNPNIKISLLGRGISTGQEIEHLDENTINNSIKNRRSI